MGNYWATSGQLVGNYWATSGQLVGSGQVLEKASSQERAWLVQLTPPAPQLNLAGRTGRFFGDSPVSKAIYYLGALLRPLFLRSLGRHSCTSSASALTSSSFPKAVQGRQLNQTALSSGQLKFGYLNSPSGQWSKQSDKARRLLNF